MSETVLTMITIYRSPRDYPDKYVAREWHLLRGEGSKASDVVVVADDLDGVRQTAEERGLHRMPRDPGDDPCIVETWI